MVNGIDEGQLAALEEIVDHKFAKPQLLVKALTHPSLDWPVNYQRLEFVGDRVLGLVLATWLYEEFADEKEGKLSRRYHSLARKETLAEIGEKLGITPFIRMSIAGQGLQERVNPGVVADVVEAIIAAIYIDGGLAVANRFIRKHWAPALADGDAGRDPKSGLQEIAQGRGLPLPHYQEEERTGPDHNPHFVMRVTVEGLGSAVGRGSSKRAAESEAAANMIEDIGE